MPIHDWTRVDAGTFHAFRFAWGAHLCSFLNRGLPAGYVAMLQQRPVRRKPPNETDSEWYARKADRIAVHHGMGNVVSLIEIVSPGNKGSRHALRSFVAKAIEMLDQGIHLLVIDLFPPSKRDPQGIHSAIWEEISDTKFKRPANKPLTLAAYSSGETLRAYVEPIRVGDVLPDMPLFLAPDRHVKTPLAASYQAAWEALPVEVKELVE